jgi:hypothetical protein
MPIKRVSPLPLAIVCGLGLSLGGCMAAIPLAQMALSRPTPSDRACPGCTTNTAASPMGDISKGLSDTFHKWTSTTPTEVTAK